MALYRCIRKCRHDKVYREGEVVNFEGKPPRHFVKHEQPKAKEETPAPVSKKRRVVEPDKNGNEE